MTMQRLLSLIEQTAGPDGFAKRCWVKAVYGAGFEGVVRHAERDGVVRIDGVEGGVELTARGRRLLQDRKAT